MDELIDNKIVPILEKYVTSRLSRSEISELHRNIHELCNPTQQAKEASEQPPLTLISLQCKLLYEKVQKFCKQFVCNEVQAICARSLDPYHFLYAYVDRCDSFKVRVQTIDKFLGELNRALRNKFLNVYGLDDVYMLTMKLWIDEMFRKRSRVIEAILKLIELERERKVSYRGILRSSIRQILCTSVRKRVEFDRVFYCDFFETDFFNATDEYYEHEAGRVIGRTTFLQYIRWASEMLGYERNRCEHYFDPDWTRTRTFLENICNEKLIFRFRQQFFDNFLMLLRSGNNSDLRLFYHLIKYDKDNLKVIEEMYDKEIEREFAAKDDERQQQGFVERVGKLIRKHERIIEQCFQNSIESWTSFQRHVRKVCEGNDLVAKLLKFCDCLLMKRDKTSFNWIASMVKYLGSNEEFVHGYVKLFGRRVLTNRFDVNVEDGLITKLDEVLPTSIAYKLTRLIRDLRQSQMLRADFQSDIEFELNLQILCYAYWPMTKMSSLAPPAVFSSVTGQVELVYKRLHPTRKLSWLWTRCSVDIVSTCFRDQYVFHVNMVQAAILLAYNHNQCLSFDELREASGLTSNDHLKSYLEQLCNARVLLKSSSTATNFELNFEYEDHESRGGHVNLASCLQQLQSSKKKQTRTETVDESGRNSKWLESSRKYWIQSAAVRLMKSMRTCPKNELYAKICDELKKLCEPPPITEITKQLNALVDREFLEFSNNIYTYVP